VPTTRDGVILWFLPGAFGLDGLAAEDLGLVLLLLIGLVVPVQLLFPFFLLIEVSWAPLRLVRPYQPLPVRQVVGQGQAHDHGNGEAEQWDNGLHGGWDGGTDQGPQHDREQGDPQLEGHEGRHDCQDIAWKGSHESLRWLRDKQPGQYRTAPTHPERRVRLRWEDPEYRSLTTLLTNVAVDTVEARLQGGGGAEGPTLAGTEHMSKAVTNATFETEVLRSDGPVLVDFWAEWCGPCKMIAPVLEEIASEHEGKLRIAKLNVDENPDVARRYGVLSIPTLVLFVGGVEKQRVVGFSSKRDLLTQLSEFVA
jgi:thioredoxin 1